LKSNEKGAVLLKVDSYGRSGLIEENVEVLSNDAARSRITLTIRVLVMDFEIPSRKRITAVPYNQLNLLHIIPVLEPGVPPIIRVSISQGLEQ